MGRRVLLVPLGSFEQHGPHLPLCTDTLIAASVCDDVAAVRDVDVAPAVPFGASGEHQGFSGLLSWGTDATSMALTELVRSARPSWRAVVLVSGHGGNVEALRRVSLTAQREGDVVAWWVPTDPDGDAHAGATETSVVLSLEPSLVHLDRVPQSPALPEGWWGLVRSAGVQSVSATGVLGDPSGATVERGRSLRAAWCAEVVAIVDVWQGE